MCIGRPATSSRRRPGKRSGRNWHQSRSIPLVPTVLEQSSPLSEMPLAASLTTYKRIPMDASFEHGGSRSYKERAACRCYRLRDHFAIVESPLPIAVLPSRLGVRTGAQVALLTALHGTLVDPHAALTANRTAEAALSDGPADPVCAVDFDSLTAVARRDYAGYQTAAQIRPAALAALTDTLRRAASGVAPGAPGCEAVLARWLSFFQDGHLALVPTVTPALPAPDAGSGSSAAPSAASTRRPSLVVLDSVTVLFRIPSFELAFKPVIDSLLSTEASILARAAALIIDVRGNGGGGDAAFGGLIPLLYTDPIRVIGADAWASPGNAAYFRGLLKIPELPASDRALVQRLVAKMERHPHSFVSIDRDTVLRVATVDATPRAVAVLFDRGSGSTTEEFLLQAQQSRKTVLFSRTRSAGALDYANVRQILLPSGRSEFRFGTSRSRRLPTQPVDRAGLMPTAPIPPDVTDEVTYVRGYLAAHTSR